MIEMLEVERTYRLLVENEAPKPPRAFRFSIVNMDMEIIGKIASTIAKLAIY